MVDVEVNTLVDIKVRVYVRVNANVGVDFKVKTFVDMSE